VLLPALLPVADVVVHDVLADVAVRYAREEQVLAGGVEHARAVGIWLSWRGVAPAVPGEPHAVPGNRLAEG